MNDQADKAYGQRSSVWNWQGHKGHLIVKSYLGFPHSPFRFPDK
jgi:hypothetical protein